MSWTGGSDTLWIYLSWDETCEHTLSRASANRFNAPLYWRVIKKITEIGKSLEGKPNTRSVLLCVWHMEFEPTATPITATGKWFWNCEGLWDAYGSHLIVFWWLLVAGHTTFHDSPLPQKMACRDPCDPPWLLPPNCINKTSEKAIMLKLKAS